MDQNVTYLGIDYHQNSLQVCALDVEGRMLLNRACVNDVAHLGRLLNFGNSRIEAAIEACSGTADLADEIVAQLGWSISLAHPGYVQRMKQNRDKTDFSDARMLADLTRVGYLPKVWLAPEPVRELRKLTRYRQDLVKRRRVLKLQIGALLRDQRVLSAPAARWTKAWLEWLRSQAPLSEQGRWIVDQTLMELQSVMERIRSTETRLAAVTESDTLVQNLLKQPGIGLVTATLLRAEIGRFDRFRTGKQLARFCGLTPRNVSSGARQADAGLIGQCNRYLRSTLIEAAHRLIRVEGHWSAMALRMCARGKPKGLVVAAIANRWIRRLYHEFKLMNVA